jgi:hypothetical protein
MALSADRLLSLSAAVGKIQYPVAASAHAYRHGYAGIDPAGYVKPFEPGDRFVGIFDKEVDNSSGTAGAEVADVLTVEELEDTLTSVALTDVGKPVFATADNGLSLTGHPDAFVGYVTNYVTTNTARVRMRGMFEKAPNGVGSIDIDLDFSQVQIANQDEATATLRVGGSAIKTAAVGAGLTSGTNGFLTNEATGEIRMLLDNDNEAQNLTIETPQVFNLTKGVTLEATFKLEAAGGAATDDLDIALAGLSGGITATERADMAATTSGFQTAGFHVDTNGLDLEVRTDDNTTAGTETDTTVNLVLQTAKSVKIIVRPAGTVEFWVANARVLSTTAFALAATGMLAGIINIEKSTGTGVPEVRVSKFRVAGALA